MSQNTTIQLKGFMSKFINEFKAEQGYKNYSQAIGVLLAHFYKTTLDEWKNIIQNFQNAPKFHTIFSIHNYRAGILKELRFADENSLALLVDYYHSEQRAKDMANEFARQEDRENDSV